MVAHICGNLNYYGSINDVIQELYTKFLTSDIIGKYNENYASGDGKSTKISTYLYRVIRNHILSKIKNQDDRIVKHCRQENTEWDIDTLYRECKMSTGYRNMIESNQCDENGNLGLELKDFYEKFLKSRNNKTYSFSRRKDKKIKNNGCSLLDVFKYLYEGYTHTEIAEMYGVSNMTVTNLKHKLAKNMIRYGFGPKPKKSQPVKSFV